MLKFLERNYPISRVKFNKRFKRGIILEGTTYLISDPTSFVALQHKLVSILILVFNYDAKISFSVLKEFLHLN